jgi:hypothetical protein
MHGTHMSFEYYGAFKALNFLLENGATRDQAEAVSEAVIRHADLGETGTLTSLGMLIQLSTVFGKSTLIFVCYLLLHCLELRRRSKAFPDHWNVRLAFCLCTLSDLQTLGSLHNRRFGKRYRVHNLSRQCATSSYIVLRTHSTQAICTANFGDNFASNEKTLTIELVRDLLRMSNTTSPEVASVPITQPPISPLTLETVANQYPERYSPVQAFIRLAFRSPPSSNTTVASGIRSLPC